MSKNNTHFFYSLKLTPIVEDIQLPSILVHTLSTITTQPKKALGRKDMERLRLECKRNLEKFLDGCIDELDKHHSARSSINASMTCMHLSHLENPLKKSNNDKGKQQLVNHAKALSMIGEDTIDKYVNDRLYIIDLIGGRDRNKSYIKNGVQ